MLEGRCLRLRTRLQESRCAEGTYLGKKCTPSLPPVHYAPVNGEGYKAATAPVQAVIRSDWRTSMLLRYRVRRKIALNEANQIVGEVMGRQG